MNPSTNCPHCGAEPSDLHWNWKCGSYHFPDSLPLRQSDLCREREAHNKTRAELEETEQVRDSWCEAYTEARDDLEATLNKNQKLREYVEYLRSQLNSPIK